MEHGWNGMILGMIHHSCEKYVDYLSVKPKILFDKYLAVRKDGISSRVSIPSHDVLSTLYSSRLWVIFWHFEPLV
jgi:hypothetical protein